MITHSGSSENITWKALVDLMRLSIEKYLAPYRI